MQSGAFYGIYSVFKCVDGSLCLVFQFEMEHIREIYSNNRNNN